MGKKLLETTREEEKILYLTYIGNFDDKSEEENLIEYINKVKMHDNKIKMEKDEYEKAKDDRCICAWDIIKTLVSETNFGEPKERKIIAINENYSRALANLYFADKAGKFIKHFVLNHRNYYFMDEECVENLNSAIIKVEKYLEQFKKLPKIDENIDSSIEKWKCEFKCGDIDSSTEKVTSNKDTLIKYIKNIVNLDSDIFSLKKRYNTLVKEHRKLAGYDYFIELVKTEDKINDEITKIDDEINELNNLIAKKPKLKQEVKIELPQKPTFNISKPKKPILKTPNIFNRKRVDAENEQLLQAFDDEMKEYNKKHEKYTKSLKEYEDKVKELTEQANKKNEEIYQKRLEEYNSKAKEYADTIEQKNKEKLKLKKELKDGIEKRLEETDINKKLKSIEYEVEFIKENIKKDIELQNKLYSYNIIYGKYRNYIAMASFIDYLVSGRCDSLDKNTGAYNLYEQESRTDIIINKMDVIIDSLEKIKENQYYIYSQLKDINNSLDLINGQLLVNNILQTVQVSQLGTMIEKADEIAYNTKVTSYYAKKTAHYTEALMFMNLIDRL